MTWIEKRDALIEFYRERVREADEATTRYHLAQLDEMEARQAALDFGITEDELAAA